MAPELFAGEQGRPAHDLYAAGVTLYHLLTRKYPYGEIEPFQHPKFGEPVPTDALPPGHPRLARKRPAQGGRQGSRAALRNRRGVPAGARTRRQPPLNRPPVTPLAMRNPLLTWRIIAGVSLAQIDQSVRAAMRLLMLLTRCPLVEGSDVEGGRRLLGQRATLLSCRRQLSQVKNLTLETPDTTPNDLPNDSPSPVVSDSPSAKRSCLYVVLGTRANGC
jgi:hypothetical protein